MTHQLLLSQINLGHRLPQPRQIKQRIIPEPAIPASLRQYLSLNRSFSDDQNLPIPSCRNHTPIPRGLRSVSNSSQALQQIQIVALIRIDNPLHNKPGILRKPGRPHPRLTSQCVYFQPRIVSNNHMAWRETAVIHRLETRILLKRNSILYRSRNAFKIRQRNHIELEDLSRSSKIAQLSRIAAGNIKCLSHKPQLKAKIIELKTEPCAR
jgi:hypothetical protein